MVTILAIVLIVIVLGAHLWLLAACRDTDPVTVGPYWHGRLYDVIYIDQSGSVVGVPAIDVALRTAAIYHKKPHGVVYGFSGYVGAPNVVTDVVNGGTNDRAVYEHILAHHRGATILVLTDGDYPFMAVPTQYASVRSSIDVMASLGGDFWRVPFFAPESVT